MQNETVADEEAMAKKIKNLTTSIQPKVTTLKLSSGQYTEIGKETCEEIMAKHFPTHTPKTNPEYNHAKVTTTEITKPDFKPWITQSHVRRVLLKFKAKKSPGPDKLKPIIFKYLPQNTLDIISFIYRACFFSCLVSLFISFCSNVGLNPSQSFHIFKRCEY